MKFICLSRFITSLQYLFHAIFFLRDFKRNISMQTSLDSELHVGISQAYIVFNLNSLFWTILWTKIIFYFAHLFYSFYIKFSSNINLFNWPPQQQTPKFDNSRIYLRIKTITDLQAYFFWQANSIYFFTEYLSPSIEMCKFQSKNSN